MVSKDTAREFRRKLIKLLPKDRLDPATRIEASLDIIRRRFEKYDFQLEPGQPPFRTATAAVWELLRHASALNKAPFWDEVELPEDLRWVGIPEESADVRRKAISTMQEQLCGESVTLRDLLDAMDTVEMAFRSMCIQFTLGTIPDGLEGVTEDMRHMCAALLSPTVEVLDRVWRPLSAKIRQKRFCGRVRRREKVDAS